MKLNSYTKNLTIAGLEILFIFLELPAIILSLF